MEYALVFLDRPDIHNVKLDTDHPVLIGRDAQRATVFLNDQSVSRIHCTVSLVPQNNGTLLPLIMDSSSFGTLINNNEIPKEAQVVLNPGDIVSLGPGGISFRLEVINLSEDTIRPGQLAALHQQIFNQQPIYDAPPPQVMYDAPPPQAVYPQQVAYVQPVAQPVGNIQYDTYVPPPVVIAPTTYEPPPQAVSPQPPAPVVMTEHENTRPVSTAQPARAPAALGSGMDDYQASIMYILCIIGWFTCGGLHRLYLKDVWCCLLFSCILCPFTCGIATCIDALFIPNYIDQANLKGTKWFNCFLPDNK